MRLLPILLLAGFATIGQARHVLTLSTNDLWLDDQIASALAARGHTTESGAPCGEFAGAAAAFDAVVLAGQGSAAMPAAGQAWLHEYVAAGGGLVSLDWAPAGETEPVPQTLAATLPGVAPQRNGNADRREFGAGWAGWQYESGRVLAVRIDESASADAGALEAVLGAALDLVNVPSLLGDLNCDEVVNALDISPFVMVLTNAAEYEIQFPDCDPANADTNGDWFINALDIQPFVRLLTGG